MSVQIIEAPHRPEDGVGFTALAPHSSCASSSAESDTDGGYSTPAENFADDELQVDRAPSPITLTAVMRTQAQDSTSEGVEVVVDPELRERIVKQVEWYFSDANLLKDAFLMKHVNRNKQGYVSLKLVASFRKVKSLTKDWKVVLESVRHSSLLALSEDETKIRRLAPPPEVDYSHATRTVIVTHYPNDEPNANTIEAEFGRFGEVALVRILYPGKAIPLDVKPSRTRHPLLGKELCVLVEYGSAEGARVACQRFKNQQSWRDEMKVQLLTEPKEQTHNRQEVEKTTKIVAPIDAGWKSKGKRQADKRKQESRQRHTSPARVQHSKESSPSPRFSREGSPEKHRGKPGSPEPSRRYLQPESWRDYSSDSGCSVRSPSQSPKSSPEPSKKFYNSSNGGAWRRHTHTRDNCVIRQPSGPDGTRGFRGNRRPISISVDSC